MKNVDFEILHFSYRPKIWKESGYGCCRVNLVFRAYEEYLFEQCMKESKEWYKTDITTDIEKAEDYLNNITIEFEEIENKKYGNVIIGNKSGYKREDVFISGYEYRMNHLLKYNEKFDTFQFNEYVQMNPATKGIITYIEHIKVGICNSRFLDSFQLLASIRALDLFWD